MIGIIGGNFMKKKLMLLGCMIVLITGCGQIPKLENGKEAVVSYKDGTLISVDDFYEKIKDEYGLTTLISMIDQTIYEKEYKDKIDEAKKDADNIIESLKASYVDDDGNYDENALLSALNDYMGLSSVEAYWNLVYINFYRTLIVESYSQSLVTNKEINNYYKDEVIGDIRCRHILISTDGDSSMSTEEKKEVDEKALKKAKDLIKQLDKAKNVEETFIQLAKDNSDDESNAKDGGDLGFFNKGKMEESFEKAAIELKIGKYTKTPIKTKYGYHIIYKIDSKDKKSLDEVRENVIKDLGLRKVNTDETVRIKALTNIREKYGVTITDSELEKQYKRLMDYNLRYAQQLNAQK